MIAPLLLAVAVGQACPQPGSANDPPPCAAADVPGCIPGYRATRDAWGRLIYVCDQPMSAPGPQAEQQAVPPPPAPQAAPAPRPSPTYYAPSRGLYQSRGVLALVFMPGIGSGIEPDRRDRAEGLGALALELRFPEGGARLRLGLEHSGHGEVADVAIKYDFLDGETLRPFVAASMGGASLDPVTDWRFCMGLSAGIDIYPSRNLFFTAELRQRWFSARAWDSYRPDVSGLRQTAFLVGVGMYL